MMCRPSGSWMCLNQASRSISTITTMLLHPSGFLYIAGWASPGSDWTGRDWGSPYAIAVLDIRGYIRDHYIPTPTLSPTPSERHTGRQADEYLNTASHRYGHYEVVDIDILLFI